MRGMGYAQTRLCVWAQIGKLVEARRIELLSEVTENREYSCFSAFLFVS
jgi:hypothetical protein